MRTLTLTYLNNWQVTMSPPTPGSVADAIGLGESGELSGGGGGGDDCRGRSLVSGCGVSADGYGVMGEGDGGRLICRRVLCRWVTGDGAAAVEHAVAGDE